MGMKPRGHSAGQKQAIADANDLIQRWEEGDCDNAAESLQEAHEILEVLPPDAVALRDQLARIEQESAEILVEVYG